MLGWRCLCWSRKGDSFAYTKEPRPFSLPSPVPEWPQGNGFGKGRICIGELEVVEVTKFREIWSYYISGKDTGATFYEPLGIPDGFFSLGHYSQPNSQSLHGFVLAAREIDSVACRWDQSKPALQKPLDYTLVWSSGDWADDDGQEDCGCFWFPRAPDGYRSMGYVVTRKCQKPSLDEVRCIRSDLTDACETENLIVNMGSEFPLFVWSTRPWCRGMREKGLSVGAFFCSSNARESDLDIACLRNTNSLLDAMPTLDQVHSLVQEYGPTVFFHPDETYLPSSVSWFFKNGALLFKNGETEGKPIDGLGSILPSGGSNDGGYWINLPADDRSKCIKQGDIETAELYVHVKPALGGTYTDLQMWIFCPFNGPATIKVGILDFPMKRVGEHVGDWEHFTLRVSNFTGELWKMYFSQHSGGEWIDASCLEFIEGNKSIVYSSKCGHASFPHPGNYLQGSSSLGVGVRNDAARSEFFVDSSANYKIIAAEYLGSSVSEPCWLQYMREWGPTIVYQSKSELDRIISILPVTIRFTVEKLFDKLPLELYGEEGPTGPKEKNMWDGDERC